LFSWTLPGGAAAGNCVATMGRQHPSCDAEFQVARRDRRVRAAQAIVRQVEGMALGRHRACQEPPITSVCYKGDFNHQALWYSRMR
jgi:hypothetical protein